MKLFSERIQARQNGVPPIEGSGLLVSCMVAILTVLMLSSTVGPAIVKPLLLDGSLISNGRFAFVYDAYETVEGNDGPSVVGIGSSILLAGMNGTCMQDESEIENTRFYNMAMSGGKPYSEMIQIPALIDANPDVVMVEVGPNSLYGWNGSKYIEGITDYNEFRFQLMSMGMANKHFGDWYTILDEIDQQWVDDNQIGRTDAWSEYTRDAIEEYLRREIDDATSALGTDSYSYVPPVGSDEWDGYLSEPNLRTSKFDLMRPEEIREYLDEKMPSKSKQGVYNPPANNTQNHRALDYMIHELLNASIEVVLVGIPHHPWVNEYLEPGQLDGMNSTYEKYESLEGVTPLQMYWEEWPSEAYSDRNHLDAEGRGVFCKRVTPIIDAILNGSDPLSVEIGPDVYEIPIEAGPNIESCVGSGLEFVEDAGFVSIEAEDYSHCLYGLWQATDSKWEFDSEINGYTGEGYVVANPDVKIRMGDTTDGPRLGYNITFSNSGNYTIWLRMSAPNGGSDSVHVGLNGLPVTYGEVGLTTSPNGEWNWESVPLNVSYIGIHQLQIWMREDGVRVDSLILTLNSNFDPTESIVQTNHENVCSGTNLTFSADLTFTQDQGLIIIEAEDFSQCSFGSMQAEDSLWDVATEMTGYSGHGYVVANPDVKINSGDATYGPHLGYNVSLSNTGVYHVWILMSAPDGGGDSIHVGLDGVPVTYGGVGLSTPPNENWNWEYVAINVTSTGLHQLDIWMREDGVRIDSIIMTNVVGFNPDNA
jgi:hypothetical protein